MKNGYKLILSLIGAGFLLFSPSMSGLVFAQSDPLSNVTFPHRMSLRSVSLLSSSLVSLSGNHHFVCDDFVWSSFGAIGTSCAEPGGLFDFSGVGSFALQGSTWGGADIAYDVGTTYYFVATSHGSYGTFYGSLSDGTVSFSAPDIAFASSLVIFKRV